MIIKHRALIKSFQYAFQGLFHTLKYNQNFKIQIVGALLVVLASIYFKVNPFEMGILGVMILLVMCAEMINTAMEEIVNLITTNHQKEAKIAKDVAAGMMLTTAFGAIGVSLIIFLPRLLVLFGF